MFYKLSWLLSDIGVSGKINCSVTMFSMFKDKYNRVWFKKSFNKLLKSSCLSLFLLPMWSCMGSIALTYQNFNWWPGQFQKRWDSFLNQGNANKLLWHNIKNWKTRSINKEESTRQGSIIYKKERRPSLKCRSLFASVIGSIWMLNHYASIKRNINVDLKKQTSLLKYLKWIFAISFNYPLNHACLLSQITSSINIWHFFLNGWR